MTIEVELLTRANHLVDAGDAFIEGSVDHHAAHLDALGLAQGSLQAHARGLHGVGVAQGFAVSIVTDANGKPSAYVAPGVAIDGLGRHVLLALGGVAETSPDAAASGASAQVTVTAAGVALPVPAVTAVQQMMLTVQHFERSEQDDSDETPMLRHTPWLRWLAPADAAADAECIALAQLTLSPTAPPSLQAGVRAKTALDAASLSVVATGTFAGVVQEQAVAQLAPFIPAAPVTQGVELSVFSPASVLRLGADSGQSVSSLALDATITSANGALIVNGACTVENALTVKQAGTFTSGLTVNGGCTVDQLKVNQTGTFTNGLTVGNVGNAANVFTVNGACTIANALTVKQPSSFASSVTIGPVNSVATELTVNGACTVTNALNVGGSCTIASALTVKQPSTFGSSLIVGPANSAATALTVNGACAVEGACFVRNGLVVENISNPANALTVAGGCEVTSTLSALNGLVANGYASVASSVASGLGPVLSLKNSGGGANAGGALDFYGYDIAGSGAAVRIQSYDDGAYSGHLSFQTKVPGAAGNGLAERMRIQSGGNVSTTGAILVVNGAGGEQMYIGGDGAGGDVQFGSMNRGITNVSAWNWNGAWMNVAGLNFLSHSDARSKEAIQSIAGALDRIMSLRGVSFRWKSSANEPATGGDSASHASAAGGARQIGLIAQEVVNVVPEAVVEQRAGSLGIAFNAITALLVEAVKEQQEHILSLEARLGVLESRTQ